MLFALKVKDKGGLKKSAKCAVFVQPENSGSSKFTVLEPTISLFQKGSFYQAKASVFVVDSTGGAVKDVAVKGRWSLPGLDDYDVSGYRAHFKKVGRYSHKITPLDKPHKLVYYNPGLE